MLCDHQYWSTIGCKNSKFKKNIYIYKLEYYEDIFIINYREVNNFFSNI